ncbi:ribosome recycling factor [Aeromicrobium sp.]|nr:ribosome recycling factor [Candidatus Saccharibacteria bacterium]
MNPNQALDDAKTKFAAAVERFSEQLKSLRTGRASSAMLDGVMAEAYGSPMPLNQLATVTAPEAQLIQITPFDATNLQAISTAIRNNPALGLNPTDDGRVVRIQIPSLTEERRREISKQVGTKQEDCMVVLRSARHDAMDAVDAAKKEKMIGEDEADRIKKQVEEAMKSTQALIDAAAKSKEQEIMSL